ncbi:DNA adenine methylase [Sphingomonas arantia]|uniref:DNA adenine methylase n=1 Tax=Sphingomonas arantia TaxID=1460676 RepID=A0ABW4TZ59_9SPHN
MTDRKRISRRACAAMSPFRYPGGKAFFAEALHHAVQALPGGITAYLEPYAGGAGAAIRLLGTNSVDLIYLNDADIRVYSAWRAMIAHNARFLDALADVVVGIDEWWHHKAIVDDPTLATDEFELGFATFFLNRTNRSGIVQGAGPIGGYAQNGDWKLDVRFNRAAMIERIKWLGANADRIKLSNMNGLKFVQQTSNEIDLERSLYFIDPPYVTAGSRLYLNAMKTRDHILLGAYLCAGVIPHWIVTYDDCELIRNTYKGAHISRLDVLYSLQKKRLEGEILVTPIAA